MKRIKIVITVVLSVAIILFALNYILLKIYAGEYYRASEEAIETVQESNDLIEIKKSKAGANEVIVFAPKNPVAGLIFYPGGKVQYEAYAPLLRKCAEKGIFCVLVHMPDNLAVLDMNAARDVIANNPDIHEWYIAGHSLGGVMSAEYIAEHPNALKGIVLLGSYTTADLSNYNIKKLSIYGTEDKVLNLESYNNAKKNLGEDYVEIVIPGGCHSYFGDYGMQEGDGNPTITRDEQMDITAKAICDIIGGKENQ
ncbi:MAG: hypothetical protein E7279_06990 [Lachnospiraceae bacterium]|nr:hypothetical protein [Lachnospiraceae bacterium]